MYCMPGILNVHCSEDKTSVKIHANASFFLKDNCYISNKEIENVFCVSTEL